jgi:peptidoglycan hydrolase-like protein with peptidoglycan-binding domain
VCALDVDHDPGGGMDVHAVADQLVNLAQAGGTNPDFEYVISNGRIATRETGWAWRRYTGSNSHTIHAHFAVGRGPDSEPRPPYDDRTSWGIATVIPQPAPTPAPAPPSSTATGWMNAAHPVLQEGDTGATVAHLQVLLGGLKVDGDFGPRTRARLVAVQQAKGLTVDGLAGDQTWGNTHPVIRQGSNGETVTELQRSIAGLSIDGDFGPRTHAAVVGYQQAKGLAADGICGAWTWQTLCEDG